MTPFKHPLCNFTYTAPPSMPECRDLNCYRHEQGTTSFWRLDPGELNQLAAGGCIAFTHFGQGHPVIRLAIQGGEDPAHPLPGLPNVTISSDLKARIKRVVDFNHARNPATSGLKQSIELAGESGAYKLMAQAFDHLPLALCFADILGVEFEVLLEGYIKYMETAHPEIIPS